MLIFSYVRILQTIETAVLCPSGDSVLLCVDDFVFSDAGVVYNPFILAKDYTSSCRACGICTAGLCEFFMALRIFQMEKSRIIVRNFICSACAGVIYDAYIF